MLNDVWRTIGKEVGFFYEANFEDVPSSPGVYAWFYPLRVLSREPEALQRVVEEVQALLNYDSGVRGPPSKEAILEFSWWNYSILAGRRPNILQLPDTLQQAWNAIVKNEEQFSEFQRTLLRASIFMPPLYVGKTDNLNTRCQQHLRGGAGQNDFHDRFENNAHQLGLRLRSVRQLVFSCVRTGPPVEQRLSQPATRVHELVERVMNGICAPPYGKR